MKAFTQIAIPHEDIVKGRLVMDVFAADLWQVAQGKAPIDYQDSDLFFTKTFITDGLKNILEIAKARLEGKSGDSIIQLQTPFGGGKTHTLIALYHKAKEWNAKVVVIDGTALNPKENMLWEEIERQLTGSVSLTKGDIPPGKEKLIELLSASAPALILMDEILEYITRAAGVKVGDSNLASQTFAFIQELTGAVATVGNAMLVLTLPSSILEHYDENAERMFHQLQKITGRVEKIYTPVKDDEIEYVVRARLFSKIDEKEAKKVVDAFVEYARNEGLLSDNEVSEYRNRFLRSYPFKPEVIDILYKRWGSFPTFQRTRGVLRLLSIVVHRLLDKNIPYVRIGDFDLSDEELRRELIKHIGQEWDSIIAQDITGNASGAKKVDESLGTSYMAYKLGTVVSTTIFMMSFSGKGEKGSGVKEIKISTTYSEFSSSMIDTVISNLKERLFYLSDEGLFFTNQPNLNRILVSREENITDEDIYLQEKEMLKKHIKGPSVFRIYIHPRFSKDVSDLSELKLVILNKEKPNKEFLEKYGENPRVYRNTLIFLCADENQKEAFYKYMRKLIALRNIGRDSSLKLSEGQRKEIKNKLKNYEEREYEELRKYYRRIFLPAKDGFKDIDLGLPTFGESQLDKEIYGYLRSQGEILEKISPKVIKDRYLSGKDYIEVLKLYEAFLKTPGELRLVSREALAEGIKEGVKDGLFGFGYIEGETPECKHINEDINIRFLDGEIIINPELCKKEEIGDIKSVISGEEGEPSSVEVKESEEEYGEESATKRTLKKLDLKLKVPIGQISTIARIANYLKTKFSKCEVEISISAIDGEIDVADYEDRILEALKQADVEIDEEKN